MKQKRAKTFDEQYGDDALKDMVETMSFGYNMEVEAPSDIVTIIWNDKDGERVARMILHAQEEVWHFPVLEVTKPNQGFFGKILGALPMWAEAHGVKCVTANVLDPTRAAFERVGFEYLETDYMVTTPRNLGFYGLEKKERIQL